MLEYKLTNGGGDLIHSGNQSQTDRGYDERVFHQILALLVPNESDQESSS
jgi:hypothetical protein